MGAVLIQEATSTLKGAVEKTGTKRFRMRIIDEGQGSSGVYPAATLRLAAKENIFPKGTHMYIDHPSVNENMDRPERSVRDLAAVLDSDAVYESGGLYADLKAFNGYADTIEEMKDDIGVSIRASAEVDEADGQRVITRLVEAQSVDFVTKAGRGGKVLEVLEGARAVASAVRHGVSEATANATRQALSKAVSAAHGGANRYAYVRDFDESQVWFSASSDYEEESRIWQRGYTLEGAVATLSGDAVEVVVQTTYVPLSAAAESKISPSNPAGVTERKEPAMGTVNLEESEVQTLRESASRATVLESENEGLKAEVATLKESAVKAAARTIVESAFEGIIAPKTVTRLAESYTLKEDGTLNADALKAEAEESAAEFKVTQGAGTPTGVGETSATTAVEARKVTDSDIIATLEG